MKLVELVKIIENNMECVILEITGTPIDLIKLGSFDGNETMIRLTKGNNHTCTIWTKTGSNYSWEWGDSGYTLVDDSTRKKGRLIQACIEEDFEIYIGSNVNLRKNTLNIMSLDDTLTRQHQIKIMYFKNDTTVCCHRDGEFFKHFKTINEALGYFQEKGYENVKTDTYTAQTGCIVEVYNITR